MLEELRDIERELERVKKRVHRMIAHLEKRQVRLSALSNDELLSEVGSRTLPSSEIEKLLAGAERPRRKPGKR